MQLEFLQKEMEESYSGVADTLKSTNDVREASDKVLHEFESPGDQSEDKEQVYCPNTIKTIGPMFLKKRILRTVIPTMTKKSH